MIAIGRAGEHALERIDAAVEDSDRRPGVAGEEMRPGDAGIVFLGREAVADRDPVVAPVERRRRGERRHKAALPLDPAELVLGAPSDAGEIAGQRLELPAIEAAEDDPRTGEA